MQWRIVHTRIYPDKFVIQYLTKTYWKKQDVWKSHTIFIHNRYEMVQVFNTQEEAQTYLDELIKKRAFVQKVVFTRED